MGAPRGRVAGPLELAAGVEPANEAGARGADFVAEAGGRNPPSGVEVANALPGAAAAAAGKEAVLGTLDGAAAGAGALAPAAEALVAAGGWVRITDGEVADTERLPDAAGAVPAERAGELGTLAAVAGGVLGAAAGLEAAGLLIATEVAMTGALAVVGKVAPAPTEAPWATELGVALGVAEVPAVEVDAAEVDDSCTEAEAETAAMAGIEALVAGELGGS